MESSKPFRIMISQPMKGKTPEEILKEREEVVKMFESTGIEVLNTVFEDEAPESEKKSLRMLGMSLIEMSKCDGVFFMEGWEKARGCVIEHMCCEQYGIPMFHSMDEF